MEGYNLKDIWDSLTVEQKNAVLRASFEGVQIKTVSRNKIEKSGRFVFDTNRIILWWRGENRPEEWDRAHPSFNNQEGE
jgi:hypothetical protein